ncbi:hypothetical protein COCSUDRAFT_52525 [Coccomyxa subellipsoidea C-169]|uniref:M-phase phosphoprotein 6 n=1 Tax=Coccomyxa subellipsoidea (strain C-169) TaxID=574566 RepID=I0Z4S2_COCSC|nr:hypothetical protein COCSUDRAFT_52525 [Coccomyxa subellipsoidea C-169]EIE25641.1 hypothetical protein COCSUDRAFT_52525 [Coccomyxa subellipsoidea C-169]|eukprot:XP_005650185.1 hypothetical protein COCSUDRAFT_52525 [Coccomyxa subellipsoidea C-169]
MAKMGVKDPGGSIEKKGFSSRLLQMKFMQRKQEKRKAEEVFEQVADPNPEDAEWVAEGSQRGCILVYEPDPPPGALLGRMGFGGFNPDAEKLQKEAEERLQAAKAGKSDTPVVSDLDMARSMGQREDRVSSMRMQKKKVRRK